jgi:hypothetical protein
VTHDSELRVPSLRVPAQIDSQRAWQRAPYSDTGYARDTSPATRRKRLFCCNRQSCLLASWLVLACCLLLTRLHGGYTTAPTSSLPPRWKASIQPRMTANSCALAAATEGGSSGVVKRRSCMWRPAALYISFERE